MQPLSAPIDLKFDFSAGPAKPGYTRVAPTAMYADDPGYGYEPGAQVAMGDNGNTTTSDKPFMFSAKVPEGNFNVTVTFGDSSMATTTTLKAESGRLMDMRVEVPAGQVVERTFTTNVRTPKLPKLPLNATGREEVRLDQFDASSSRDWDDKLTVEVVSPHAALRSIEIVSAPNAPTIFIAGDSTVTDRDGGGDVSLGTDCSRLLQAGRRGCEQRPVGRDDEVVYECAAPGQDTEPDEEGRLSLYPVHAQRFQGELAADLRGAGDHLQGVSEGIYRRGPPAWRNAGAGDGDGSWRSRHRSAYPWPWTAIRKRCARLREEEHVALIDLYSMSDTFYESAGADASKILADGTHSTAYGGYEFAKCIVMGIKQNKLDLANYIVDGFKDFDPAHPDSADSLNLGELFTSGGGRGPRPGGPGAAGAPRGVPGAAPGANPQSAPRDPGLGPL